MPITVFLQMYRRSLVHEKLSDVVMVVIIFTGYTTTATRNLVWYHTERFKLLYSACNTYGYEVNWIRLILMKLRFKVQEQDRLTGEKKYREKVKI